MCGTVFANVDHTVRRHRRSWHQARCLPNLTRHEHVYVPTESRLCPYSQVSDNHQCQDAFNSLEVFRVHLASHLPPSPFGSWPQPAATPAAAAGAATPARPSTPAASASWT
eukprot:3775167-Pyramimonas_sp.AAC.1